jgi:hypothetical protein
MATYITSDNFKDLVILISFAYTLTITYIVIVCAVLSREIKDLKKYISCIDLKSKYNKK